jgi:site-specific DNA-methyltransferase (adenine-specific)
MRELNYIDETIEKDENPALRIGSVGRSALSTVYLMDCVEGMKQFPDKIFDLAVVDPPYGIMQIGMKITKPTRPNSYKTPPKHKAKQWDNRPTENYWAELFRVSKNQIVWGGNYFTDYLPVSGCWLFWDKINGDGSHFADGEFAWTSLKTSSKRFTCSVFDGLRGGKDRIHPTEKPIKLYDWILQTFASEGNLILDTHLGSQSSRIAANKAGLDFVGFEIDREYFDNGNKRFKNFVSQGVLF